MSPVAYNFKKGVDMPPRHMLSPFLAGASYHGTSNSYDGSRYVYWAIQFGVVSLLASTTHLYRYDTWTDGWQYLATLTTSNHGLDIEYDATRKVVWCCYGVSQTAWGYFNANATAVTLAGVTTQPMVMSAALSPVLGQLSAYSSALVHVEEAEVLTTPANTGVVTTGSTATNLLDTTAGEFHAGLLGCYVRYTSGAQFGNRRTITAIGSATSLTTLAFAGAPAAGDAYAIEVPQSLTASSATASTLVVTGESWTVNVYRDSDVEITAGTGSGQRRRIASNTATTLTLAAAVTGNPRTGNWATTPDATSVFRIIPSSDFLYYVPSAVATGSTSFYRIDVVATTLAWVAQTVMPGVYWQGGGAFHTPTFAPFSIVAFRGGGTSGVYRYDIGLQAWATLTTNWGAEVLTLGGTAARIPGRGRFAVHIAATNRLYIFNPVTGVLDAAPALPYAVPVAYDGKRLRYIKTADGAEFLYWLRAGGQELIRMPCEWL